MYLFKQDFPATVLRVSVFSLIAGLLIWFVLFPMGLIGEMEAGNASLYVGPIYGLLEAILYRIRGAEPNLSPFYKILQMLSIVVIPYFQLTMMELPAKIILLMWGVAHGYHG
ncbi:MAG: hypothetical protein J6Y37_09610 [Paludibacteraceae bacterium]|nr:hypothetical protein [Paludibacteraceae bacterium]